MVLTGLAMAKTPACVPHFAGVHVNYIMVLLQGLLCGIFCATDVSHVKLMHLEPKKSHSNKWYDPGWDFAPKFVNTFEFCLDANKIPGQVNNSRLLHLALPSGDPPKDGWPVMVFLQVIGYGSSRNISCEIPKPPPPMPSNSSTCFSNLDPFGKVCGSTQYRHGGNRIIARQCVQCAERHIDWRTSNCSYVQVEIWCGMQLSHQKSYQPWALPSETLSGCLSDSGDSGVYNQSSVCAGEFEPHAGALWEQRYKQILLANGVAYLTITPYKADYFDMGMDEWRGGLDKDYFSTLFDAMGPSPQSAHGPLAKLSRHKVILQGWSVGAHMVSWLIECSMRKYLDFTVAAGLMFSGASYACYGTDDVAVNNCVGCDMSDACNRMEAPCEISNASVPKCSSCNAADDEPTCCALCCPRNYTEQYFDDYPEQYHLHPPVFLSQMSTYDINADLCATRNYHATMVANNATARILLIPPEQERCFCIGSPNDPASAGSPYRGYCTKDSPSCVPATERSAFFAGNQTDMCCLGHSMGYSDVVPELVNLVMKFI
eukprot:m.133456 g.133456  ORF g.133456 m.133456 type:complete len:544 (+) comp17541_c0_seq3:216-1847(+)